jgi:hypothetical protein
MLSSNQRQSVYIGIVVLFLASMVMAADLGRKHHEYLPPPDQQGSGLSQTPFQALVPAILGTREIMASLLWIRTDDYFHRGEYRPIIRLVKLITTIDPHQIDVYATGAWHMSYNFMDKRLIREGIDFLKGGVENNPSIYDLYFESGYTHMDKTHDFPMAISWYRQAATKKTTEGKPAPMYVGFQLAHALEKDGKIDEAVKQWELNVERANEIFAKNGRDFAAMQNRGVALNNLKMTKWRIGDRRDNATDQADTQLEFTVKKVGPRQLSIEGAINVLDLSRVLVTIRDKNWRDWEGKDIDTRLANETLEWDSVQVRGGKFKRILKLNVDPADMGRAPEEIYPLKSDEYELSVQFNPRTQAVFIQDRYGWNGEGLTDKHYLKIDPARAGVVEGKTVPLRYVEKVVTLKKSDIM